MYVRVLSVDASKFDHLNRVIAELKRTKSKLSTVETSSAAARSRFHSKGKIRYDELF